MSAGTKSGGRVLLAVAKILGLVVVLLGAAHTSGAALNRIGVLEDRIQTVEGKVSSRASDQDVRDLRKALGEVQQDVGLICAELVRQRGGSPLSECRSYRE